MPKAKALSIRRNKDLARRVEIGYWDKSIYPGRDYVFRVITSFPTWEEARAELDRMIENKESID